MPVCGRGGRQCTVAPSLSHCHAHSSRRTSYVVDHHHHGVSQSVRPKRTKPRGVLVRDEAEDSSECLRPSFFAACSRLLSCVIGTCKQSTMEVHNAGGQAGRRAGGQTPEDTNVTQRRLLSSSSQRAECKRFVNKVVAASFLMHRDRRFVASLWGQTLPPPAR